MVTVSLVLVHLCSCDRRSDRSKIVSVTLHAAIHCGLRPPAHYPRLFVLVVRVLFFPADFRVLSLLGRFKARVDLLVVPVLTNIVESMSSRCTARLTAPSHPHVWR